MLNHGPQSDIAIAKACNVLLVSEFNPEDHSSGCMHLNDICLCIQQFGELSSVFIDSTPIDNVSNNICETNALAGYREWLLANPSFLHRKVFSSRDEIIRVELFPDLPYLYTRGYYRNAAQARNNNKALMCARRIRYLMSKRNITHCLIHVQSCFSYQVAAWLIKMPKPVIPIILDPLDSLIHFKEYNHYLITNIRRLFSNIIIDSHSIIAASPHAACLLYAMGAKKVEVAMATYRLGNEAYAALSTYIARRNIPSDSIDIVMCGQVYAISAVEAFLRALDIYAARFNKRIRFDYYGNQFQNISFRATSEQLTIEDKGTLPYAELAKAVNAYHFGYTPYPFEPELDSTSTFSFPSKFVSYLEAGILPIFHGRANSSVFRLLQEFGLETLSITSVEEEDVIGSISNIFYSTSDENYLAAYVHSLLRCADLFTRDRLTANLQNALL